MSMGGWGCLCALPWRETLLLCTVYEVCGPATSECFLFFVFHAIFLFIVFKCAFQFMFFFFLKFCRQRVTKVLKKAASVRNVTVNVFLYIGVYMCIHVIMLYTYWVEA